MLLVFWFYISLEPQTAISFVLILKILLHMLILKILCVLSFTIAPRLCFVTEKNLCTLELLLHEPEVDYELKSTICSET